MSNLQFTNFAFSTLASAINDNTSTLVVKMGDNNLFPQVGKFRAVIWSDSAASPALDPLREIVEASHIDGDTFSIVRGLEGTIAKNWDSLCKFAHTLTAGTLVDIYNHIQHRLSSYAIATGTNSIAVVLAPPLPALESGVTLKIKILEAPTGASSLRVNTLGAKKLYIHTGTIRQVNIGDIPANSYVIIQYDEVLDDGNGGWIIMQLPLTDATTLSGKSLSWFAPSTHVHDYAALSHVHDYASPTHNHDDSYPLISHSHLDSVDGMWIKASIKDATPAVPSLRTLGTGPNQAMPGDALLPTYFSDLKMRAGTYVIHSADFSNSSRNACIDAAQVKVTASGTYRITIGARADPYRTSVVSVKVNGASIDFSVSYGGGWDSANNTRDVELNKNDIVTMNICNYSSYDGTAYGLIYFFTDIPIKTIVAI